MHGKFSVPFIACLIRRASTRVQTGDIEAALKEIYKVSYFTLTLVIFVAKDAEVDSFFTVYTSSYW